MNSMLKTSGLLLTSLVIGLSTFPIARAADITALDKPGEESAFAYCHEATDFTKCMKAERDGSAEELRVLKSKVRALRPITYWLIVMGRHGGKYDYGTTSVAFQVPMRSETECEAAGLKITTDGNIHGKVFEHVRYSCIKGK